MEEKAAEIPAGFQRRAGDAGRYRVRHRGEDVTGKLLELFEKHPKFSRTEKVRIDVLRRLGFYSTTHQWGIITGGTQVFAQYPSWGAGSRNA